MSRNIELTRAFIAAWERRDIEAIIGACAEDIFYHNIPTDPMIGPAAMRQFAEPFLRGCDHVAWDLLSIAETPAGVVLTERVDRFELKNGKRIALPVMGAFAFDGAGKLTQWRDYFDMAQFQKQMA